MFLECAKRANVTEKVSNAKMNFQIVYFLVVHQCTTKLARSLWSEFVIRLNLGLWSDFMMFCLQVQQKMASSKELMTAQIALEPFSSSVHIELSHLLRFLVRPSDHFLRRFFFKLESRAIHEHGLRYVLV